jgi:hypothetical protein
LLAEPNSASETNLETVEKLPPFSPVGVEQAGRAELFALLRICQVSHAQLTNLQIRFR